MTVLPGFIAYGDSNMANSDQFSWYERSLAKRYPYFRMNSAGQGLGQTIYDNVTGQVGGHRYVIIAMGTNNFGASGVDNLAALQGDITRFRDAGVTKVLACTLPPTTSSTDNWTTVANQTPSVGTSPQREDLNDLIRAMASDPGGSNADAVFDAASYVEVNSSGVFTINGRLWAVRSSPHHSSAEYGTGPHYSENGMDAAAVGGTLAINRLVGGQTGFLQQNPNLGT